MVGELQLICIWAEAFKRKKGRGEVRCYDGDVSWNFLKIFAEGRLSESSLAESDGEKEESAEHGIRSGLDLTYG